MAYEICRQYIKIRSESETLMTMTFLLHLLLSGTCGDGEGEEGVPLQDFTGIKNGIHF